MSDGTAAPRTRAQSLRFDVVQTEVHEGNPVPGFQVQVFVDGVEMTSRGAGLGMGPFSLLIPENKLVATSEPRMVPIARCTCGTYGCGVTDVRILRQDGVVHWDWLGEVPVDDGVTFGAAAYDAEVARVGAERSWERPQDTAQRLVLTGADDVLLAGHGLTLRWAEPAFDDPSDYQVVLQTTDNVYQVFLRFPLRGRSPVDAVEEVLETLGTVPATWQATFHPMPTRVTEPPVIAGPGWTREPFGRRGAN